MGIESWAVHICDMTLGPKSSFDIEFEFTKYKIYTSGMALDSQKIKSQ